MVAPRSAASATISSARALIAGSSVSSAGSVLPPTSPTGAPDTPTASTPASVDSVVVSPMASSPLDTGTLGLVLLVLVLVTPRSIPPKVTRRLPACVVASISDMPGFSALIWVIKESKTVPNSSAFACRNLSASCLLRSAAARSCTYCWPTEVATLNPLPATPPAASAAAALITRLMFSSENTSPVCSSR